MRHTVVLPITLLALAACGESDPAGPACTGEIRPNVTIEVRDSLSGFPLADAAVGTATSGSFTTTLTPADSLWLTDASGEEHPGRYDLSVSRAGYRAWTGTATVAEDGCHVQTATVRVRLLPSSSPIVLEVLNFEEVGESIFSGTAATVQVVDGGILVTGRGVRGQTCDHIVPVGQRWGSRVDIDIGYPGLPGSVCNPAPGTLRYSFSYALPPGTYRVVVNDVRSTASAEYDQRVEVR